MTTEELTKQLFFMAYQWGRANVVVNEKALAYQDVLQDLLSLHSQQFLDCLPGEKEVTNPANDLAGNPDDWNISRKNWNSYKATYLENLKKKGIL